jgi:hypothetical protein
VRLGTADDGIAVTCWDQICCEAVDESFSGAGQRRAPCTAWARSSKLTRFTVGASGRRSLPEGNAALAGRID